MSLISLFRSDTVSKNMVSDVFEGKGPLATFSAKIEVCAGLGSITPDVRHDLKIVNKMRNEFAHSPVQLYLKDFNSCLSLRSNSKINIQDDCKQRAMFKQSCLGIIGQLGFGTLLSMAAKRFLAANWDGVKKEYDSMVQSVDIDEELVE
jgi:DNA-binding MltR family transcriptional regulator